MINGKTKVWLPAISARSGTDVFTVRLAQAFETCGISAEISWFPLRYELMPFLLKKIQPPVGTDIVFANSWNGFAFKRTGLPLVITEHHCVFDPALRKFQSAAQNLYHHLLIRRYEKRSFESASAITAVSNFTAESLCRCTEGRVAEVIYNWVDTEKFCPPSANIRSDGPFRLLYVGNMSRRKGADLLAPIMRQLGPKFELRFTAGLKTDGTERIPDNMIPLGRLTDQQLVAAYQECDALLFPTRFEGFGYAALEAMACGKPVIASNNSSLPEVIVDGVSGILCDTDDIDSFADACRTLAGNPERCMAMGNAGRQYAMEKFSEETAVAHYLALVRRLCHR